MIFSPQEIDWITKISVAALLGFLLGTERGLRHKPASWRTFSFVSAASCIFCILSQITTGDPNRIAAQIVAGIGFIGAGIIFKTQPNQHKHVVEGVTSASMIWFACAIGMCCGFGLMKLACACCVIYAIVLAAGMIFHRIIDDPLPKYEDKKRKTRVQRKKS